MNYVPEPEDKTQFTEQFDRFYTSFSQVYDLAVKIMPFWKRWIKSTLPHIQGPRVLEVSFGTGYLLMQFVDQYETYGIDYNQRFVDMLQERLAERGKSADIRQGNVETLPYEDDYFDSIVNTMAFTAYPDGQKALGELHRVLKPGGKLVMVDVNFPLDGNRLGTLLTKGWIAGGDIVRDMGPLFDQFGFEYSDQEVGGFGSVHLYIAVKVSEN